MTFLTRNRTIAASLMGGVILLFAASATAQEKASNRDDNRPIKLRIPFRFGDGMTAIDPSSVDKLPTEPRPSNDKPPVLPSPPKRTSLGWDKSPKGYPIERFNDGSSIELRPECQVETLCNGTKVEKLPEGTTIVRWPQGGGVVRYPDGTGAAFYPDTQDPSRSSDLSPVEGTVEVLPGGVIRQTLKDGKTSFDKYPDGTIRSPADFGKPEPKSIQMPTQSMGKDISNLPMNPFREKTTFGKSTLMPMVKPPIIK